MKSYNYLFISMAAAIAVVACSKTEIQEPAAETLAEEETVSTETPGVEMTFTAWYGKEDSGTKTVRESNGKVYWVSGDKISMFKGAGSKTGGDIFTSSKNSEGATDASGNFELANFTGTMTSTASGSYFGLYPYDATATCDGTYITTTLPSEQTAAEGTFANNLFISVGKSSSTEMAFYNLCGGIKFTLSQSGITKIVIKGNNDEVLAGKVKIGINSANCPEVNSVVDGSTEITLTTADGSAFKTGVAYYFICLPSAIENGFKVTLRKDTSVATYNYSNSAGHSIQRSVFGNLSNIDSGLSWTDAINFYDPYFKAALLECTTVDTNGDGEISTTEAAALTSINFEGDTVLDVTDCREMKYFTGLTSFYSWGFHPASGLDMSACTKLTAFRIMNGGKGYFNFDISKCVNLESLYIEFDNTSTITSLDFTKYTKLKALFLGGYFDTVDLSKCTQFTYACIPTFNDCHITNLNLSNQEGPGEYAIVESTITNFIGHDMKEPEASVFSLENTHTKSVDVSMSECLRAQISGSSELTSVNISGSIGFVNIYDNSSLKTLDLSNVTGYYGDLHLNVYNNALTSLTLPSFTGTSGSWFEFNCYGNQLTTLNIRGISADTIRLDCSPMNNASGTNTLATLYVTAAQNNISGVTVDRSTDKIPAETQIISTSGSIDDTTDENW